MILIYLHCQYIASIIFITANAACAVGRQAEIGSLEPGKKMDVILYEVPSRAYLAYELGPNPIRHVVRNGRLVVRDGRRV